MTKDEAKAKIILKLAPHLAISLKKLDNPVPEINEIVDQIDENQIKLGDIDD